MESCLEFSQKYNYNEMMLNAMLNPSFMHNNNALVDLQRLDCGLSVTGGCFDLFGEELKVGPNKNSLAYFIFRLLQKLNSLGTVPAVDWNKYAMVMSEQDV